MSNTANTKTEKKPRPASKPSTGTAKKKLSTKTAAKAPAQKKALARKPEETVAGGTTHTPQQEAEGKKRDQAGTPKADAAIKQQEETASIQPDPERPYGSRFEGEFIEGNQRTLVKGVRELLEKEAGKVEEGAGSVNDPAIVHQEALKRFDAFCEHPWFQAILEKATQVG